MILYYAPYSPASRAVLLVAANIGVPLETHFIDIFKGEQYTPEYEEINPAKKLPFLVDEDFKLGESRAIMAYLADKYGEGSGILPDDPRGRALVNLALNFDISSLFRAMYHYYFPVIFRVEDDFSPEKYRKLQDAFRVLETMLEGQDYVAAENLTIADLSILATVTTVQALGMDISEYENVSKWVDRVKEETPDYEKINVEGIGIMKQGVDQAFEGREFQLLHVS